MTAPDGLTEPDGPPDSASPFTAVRTPQLLLDLLGDPLDAGYRDAARRRAAAADVADPTAGAVHGGRPGARRDTALACAGLLAAGFIAATGYVTATRAAPQSTLVHQRLVHQVTAVRRSADALADDVTGDARALDAARARVLPGDASERAALQSMAIAAGEVAVSGPGVSVELGAGKVSPSSSPLAGRAGTTPLSATNTLTDRDVRSVVGELWRDGAEAVAVNGVRLTAQSAIRFAGQAVLVDFQPVTPPYRIQAIGDPDMLSTAFAQSDVASRYNTLAGLNRVSFTFATSTRLALAAGVAAPLRYAKPVAR